MLKVQLYFFFFLGGGGGTIGKSKNFLFNLHCHRLVCLTCSEKYWVFFFNLFKDRQWLCPFRIRNKVSLEDFFDCITKAILYQDYRLFNNNKPREMNRLTMKRKYFRFSYLSVGHKSRRITPGMS